MGYCCVCCRVANHPIKSFHCSIDGEIYHYCHRHAFIGIRVASKYMAKQILTKEQTEFWEEVKKEYLGFK